MTARRILPITAAGVAFAAMCGIAALDRAAPGWAGVSDPPALGPGMVARALSSEVPAHPTMSDEIGFYESGLVERGDEEFPRKRLISAHLLRFRAYGDAVDLEAAERHLTTLETRAQRSPDLLSMRATLDLTSHRFADARKHAAEAVRAAGLYDPDLILRQFDALWASGEYERASKLLELPNDTASVQYLTRQARVLDRSGHVEEARDRLREAVAKIRAYAEPPAVLAWALVELGRFEQHAGDVHRAVELYLEAIDVLPGSPSALESLAGVAYMVDRDLPAARELYRRALDHGAHLDVLPVLADVEEGLGNRDEARRLRDEFVLRATATDASLDLYRRPLAQLLAESPLGLCSALELARADLAQRTDSGAWDTLAWALMRAGDVDAAYEASKRATSWGAPEPDVAYRAGSIAAAYGDRERARELLRVAFEGRTELAPTRVEDLERRLDGPVEDPPPPTVVECSAPSSRAALSPEILDRPSLAPTFERMSATQSLRHHPHRHDGPTGRVVAGARR